MEVLKITAVCLLAGTFYGVIHDQVTVRVCLEYFTVFHPNIFHTQSPTILAFGWGLLATWWASLFIGVALAMAARLGRRPRFSASELVPKIARLLAIMTLCALVAGISGYFLQGLGMEYYATRVPKAIRHTFYADLWGAYRVLLHRIRRWPDALHICLAEPWQNTYPHVICRMVLRTRLSSVGT